MRALTQNIRIVEAEPSDAKAMNDYLRDIYTYERHMITRGDEVAFGPASQRKWIKQKQDNPLNSCMIAKDMDHDGRLVGMLDSWTDTRVRVRHVTCFAMTVHAAYRRKGIGRALLEHFCRWVAAHPVLEKIELHVHADNVGAKTLYDTMGFQLEGRRKEAIRYEDGRIVDDLLMAFWPARPKIYGPEGRLK